MKSQNMDALRLERDLKNAGYSFASIGNTLEVYLSGRLMISLKRKDIKSPWVHLKTNETADLDTVRYTITRNAS